MKYFTLAALVGAASATDCATRTGFESCMQYETPGCYTPMKVNGKLPDATAMADLAKTVNQGIVDTFWPAGKTCNGYQVSDDKKSFKNYLAPTCMDKNVTISSYSDSECKTATDEFKGTIATSTCFTVTWAGATGPSSYVCDMAMNNTSGGSNDGNNAKTFGASVVIASLAVASTLF